MACTGTLQSPGQTLAQRMVEVQATMRALEQALQQGTVRIQISPQGAIQLSGWTQQARNGISDVCAFRSLTATNSWALKQAVMRAEQLQGRKVNPQAIQAGIHTHDGKNWAKH